MKQTGYTRQRIVRACLGRIIVDIYVIETRDLRVVGHKLPQAVTSGKVVRGGLPPRGEGGGSPDAGDEEMCAVISGRSLGFSPVQ